MAPQQLGQKLCDAIGAFYFVLDDCSLLKFMFYYYSGWNKREKRQIPESHASDI